MKYLTSFDHIYLNKIHEYIFSHLKNFTRIITKQQDAQKQWYSFFLRII